MLLKNRPFYSLKRLVRQGFYERCYINKFDLLTYISVMHRLMGNVVLFTWFHPFMLGDQLHLASMCYARLKVCLRLWSLHKMGQKFSPVVVLS